MPSRLWLLAAAGLFLAACAPKSIVQPEEAVDFGAYRHFGVAPFSDPKGRGVAIAEAFGSRLAQATLEPVDQKTLAKVLARYKPDRDVGYRAEELETIRSQTGADALILGKTDEDWASVLITVIELDSGAPILHARLLPHHRGEKAFTSPEEMADEFARVYSKLR